MNGRERGIELIHAEIDGELTGPQRAELSRLLLAQPALRDVRAGLRRTCGALDSLALEEPPAGLRASIMESLPASPPVCEDRDVRPRARFGRLGLRYAAAFAGGLIVSAMAFQFAIRDAALDTPDLAGTIAAVTADPSRLDLHLDEVHGTVRLDGTAAAPVLVAELAASRPVQVIGRLDGEEVRLAGFAATQQRSSAGFTPSEGRASARVEVRIVGATGDVLQTTTLRPNVAERK